VYIRFSNLKHATKLLKLDYKILCVSTGFKLSGPCTHIHNIYNITSIYKNVFRPLCEVELHSIQF
jgi:hypothetical protein